MVEVRQIREQSYRLPQNKATKLVLTTDSPVVGQVNFGTTLTNAQRGICQRLPPLLHPDAGGENQIRDSRMGHATQILSESKATKLLKKKYRTMIGQINPNFEHLSVGEIRGQGVGR
jgi:hypothetical protein